VGDEDVGAGGAGVAARARGDADDGVGAGLLGLEGVLEVDHVVEDDGALVVGAAVDRDGPRDRPGGGRADPRLEAGDRRDPRGGDEYNRQLSQSRAESVVGYLSQNHQIDRSRLKPVGKGPSQLLNPARPEAPENRRVTIRRLDN